MDVKLGRPQDVRLGRPQDVSWGTSSGWSNRIFRGRPGDVGGTRPRDVLRTNIYRLEWQNIVTITKNLMISSWCNKCVLKIQFKYYIRTRGKDLYFSLGSDSFIFVISMSIKFVNKTFQHTLISFTKWKSHKNEKIFLP